MNDQTTFFLAFLALFGGIAWYLLRLDRQAKALEERLAMLEARGPASGSAAPAAPGHAADRAAPVSNDAAANDKKDHAEDGP